MLGTRDIPLQGGWGRFRCTHCGKRILDAADAHQALGRGAEIFPADAATAERVATRLEQAGDTARALVIRTWASNAFQPAPPRSDP